MWRNILARRQRWSHIQPVIRRRLLSTRPVIEIKDATFYKHYPSDSDRSKPAIFPDLSFTLPSGATDRDVPATQQYWAVISPYSVARTSFLQVLAGQHVCIPPTARRFPYLSDIGTTSERSIKYVGFDADRGSSVGGTSVRGAYLSARYESRREETDFTVHNYLLGQTELNALKQDETDIDLAALDEVVKSLSLGNLLSMPVANLSNGQTRRARIAKALMGRPEVLLLDGPFMGLDPNTLSALSGVLRQLAAKNRPRLVISLRPEDVVPEWINQLVVVDEQLRVLAQGKKPSVLQDSSSSFMHSIIADSSSSETTKLSRDGFPQQAPALTPGEVVIAMNGVKVSYGTKTALGDWKQDVDGQDQSGLWWSLRRGQRAGIFGANGSGKTTILSLITSDHPQTYSLPIKLFGRSRLPEPGQPGISVFDLQRRMGHSSPEVHAFFPRQLTVRRALESAFADAPMAKPILNADARRRVSACLQWFARELNPSYKDRTLVERVQASSAREAKNVLAMAANDDADIAWATDMRFGELTFSGQRLALFLRAIVASPDLVILDEAFSGMDEVVRDKALLFLSRGENVNTVEGNVAAESMLSKLDATVMTGMTPEQALLVISHAKEDVPGCVREWICLPEPDEGKAPRTGSLDGPLELNPKGWDEIWGRE
jgi:ABC-type molybdenum transport system ATPase subunit/photorepair protein PhrA